MKYTWLALFLWGIIFPLSGQRTADAWGGNGEEWQADLKFLRKKYPQEPLKATPTEVENAGKMLKLRFLQRTADGSVQGTPLSGEPEITWAMARELGKTTRALAFAAATKQPGAAQQLDLWLDYLWAEQAIERTPRFRYSSYEDVRKVPADFLSALSVCDSLRKTRLIAGVKGLIEFDQLYLTPEELATQINSDYLYNAIQHAFVCALHHPDEAQAMADLKAFSNFLSACSQYVPGGKDLLKPDGTGFHHQTHYNGYMYSYRTWVEYMGRLKGTAFRIDKEAYQRISKAVVSTYLMATRSASDKNRYYANSLAGRHPFTGMSLNFTQKLFELLVEVGGDVEGKEIDPELASCYNYFFQTQKYKGVPEANLEGFYQFNYSPIGVYRYNNWVATMRCPTTKFWGGELYDRTNRMGRYQSHGTLEVLYDGPLKDSGYPDDKEKKGSGWNWNMPPGGTTVHYTSWQEMMPNGNNKDRFDQWAQTTNFAGALAWGHCGMFAAAFDQGDRWGSRRFEPTNLSFCKSVFAFDGMLVSIGSGISAPGEYADDRRTATHLFQSLGKGPVSFVVNGKEIKPSTSDVINVKEKDVWLISPHTTGYYLPAGNDPLMLKYDKQETPSSAGISEGKLKPELAAFAYLNHGVKPQNKGYYFVVVPGSTPQSMKKLAGKLRKKGELFDVLLLQDSAHVVKHIPSATVAYALFAPATELSCGRLQSSDSEMLVMEREDAGVLSLALCNPNLRPVDDKEFKWKATPTQATLTVKGLWQWAELPVGEEALLVAGVEETTLQVTLSEGAPLYLKLKKKE